MAHQLDFIKRKEILRAIKEINNGAIPKDHEWSEYWLKFENKLYQFKYLVEVASTYTSTPITTIDFTSNDSSRNFIASLGFQILFKSKKEVNSQVNYWVGASYYGLPTSQVDMFKDFIKHKYWRTDHDLKKEEGLKIYNDLKRVKINDRVCIRYFDKKGGKVHIAAIGTVNDISTINDGRLGIVWDYNPPEYKGVKPSGAGSGNWWKTLFQLTRHEDIEKIFSERLIENRVARITWNDFGWVMPSGSFGKSNDKESHEARYGYGHEEWLFDMSKLIDGYHYGFLEPIRKQQDAYSGKTYNVWLYSINGETKKRFWIGDINNLIVIDKDEAERIKQIYLNKGWFEEMKEQIKASGANGEGFSNWKGVDLFNVKFDVNSISVNDPYYEIPENHAINEQSRYSFAHFKEIYALPVETGEEFGFTSSDNDVNDDDKQPKSKTYTREPKAIEILYLHRAISNSLTKYLKLQYGKDNVTREHSAGYGANKIDIVAKDGDRLTFYEIKTYNSLKTSIREAFGQLMEYCCFPNKKKAHELIIVTHIPSNKETEMYIQHIRDTFNIPLYYQSYNLENKVLSKKC